MSVAFDAVYLERQVKRSGLRRLVRQFYLRRHRRLCSGPTLDFGCGAGDLLAMLPQGSAGFEINPHAVAHARARGLDIVSLGSDADAPDLPGIAPGRFETLFCGHVLEHLDDPGVTPGGSSMPRTRAASRAWCSSCPATAASSTTRRIASSSPATASSAKG